MSQQALGSICVPRHKAGVRRRRITEMVLPGVKSKGQREKLAVSRGRNGVEVIAASHGQARSGRREPVIIRGGHENLKVNLATATTTSKYSICFVVGFLFEDLTLPVRMF